MGLKEYRNKRNFTQEETARATGITLRTYQNIEMKNDTNLIKAKKIAEFFNDSIEEIFFK